MHEQRLKDYFGSVIVPLVAEVSQEMTDKMTISVSGSYAIGVADDMSDLDCCLYVPDDLYERHFAEVQLRRIHHLPLARRFIPRPTSHGEMCLGRLSELQANPYLSAETEPPWEEDLASGKLYELRRIPIIRDPFGLLSALKDATQESRFPEALWRKQLLLTLQSLIGDHLGELRGAAARQRWPEATVILGCVVDGLLRVGFLVNRSYYPWRKHYVWAFEQLPRAGDEILALVRTICSESDWSDRLAAIDDAILVCTRVIEEDGLLPGVNMHADDLCDELIWARDSHAWDNPGWRVKMLEKQAKATAKGYDPRIWALLAHYGLLDDDAEPLPSADADEPLG